MPEPEEVTKVEDAKTEAAMPEFGKLRNFALIIGGKERPAVLDLNTLDQILNLTSKSLPMLMANLADARVDEMISIVYSCLNQADPAISRAEVSSWLNYKKIQSVILALTKQLATWQIEDGEASLAPYVQLPEVVKKEAFDSLNLSTGQTLLDIGCGEGGVLISALAYAPLKAVFGVELNAGRAAVAKQLLLTNTENEKIAKVSVHHGDICDYTLPLVDAVYLYLLQESNDKLAPVLKARYAGAPTKIVSVDFTLPFPLTSRTEVTANGKVYQVYMYDMAECLPDPVS